MGAEGGACTMHSMLKWIGGGWEKVWGATFPSVLSSWLCWFRGMNCMKHFQKNLQGITLGHVDTVQSDICSNQLLRKVRVFLLAGLTQLILETQHSFAILSCHIQCQIKFSA